MGKTWATVKNEVREIMLQDTPKDGVSFKYTDTLLYSILSMALSSLASHTCRESYFAISDTTLKGDGVTNYNMATDTVFELPSDVYEDFERTAVVYYTTIGSTKRFFLVDLYGSPNTNNHHYWLVNDQLHLSKAIGASSTLHLYYYGYWSLPSSATDDAFVMDYPRWADHAVYLLMATNTLTATAVRTSFITRFNSNEDSGNPEHNSLRQQQEWMYKQYLNEINSVPRQKRNQLRKRYGINA